MNASTALQQGAALLEKHGITAPRLTAEVLLAHALHCERVDLYAHPERELTQVEQVHFGRYLHERLARQPTQYITGRQEFYGCEFRVSPATLIPRPETELLVEAALRHAAGSRRILDVGTGSGCLAITLQKEWPHAVVFASDNSMPAIAVARENARRLETQVDFFCADMLEACRPAAFDLIVSNPPYVPEEEYAALTPEVRDHEPPGALLAGRTGMDCYERLLTGATRALSPGGWLILELGHDTRPKLEPLVGNGWSTPVFERDLAGFDRVMVVRKATVL